MSPILNHFKTRDPVMYGLALKFGIPELTPSTDYFLSLCESIVSQQLSVKAADTIFARFTTLFPQAPTPEGILRVESTILRTCGLSNAKVAYIQDLARHVTNGSLDLSTIDKLPDEEVITRLVAVKGIGRWTAEMFLIFSLAREDVFSYGDLGLRNAIQQLYQIEKVKLIPKYIGPLVTSWSPYRSYASRLLWKSLS